MVSKKLTSLQHPLVKHWVKLRVSRAYREETGRVLIAGEKMVRELRPERLIALHPEPSLPSKETVFVSQPILKKITGLSNPDGYAAEMAMPPQQDLSRKRFLLILDQLADPGNLGTLMRTALALGWEGMVVTPSTVDLFNDKALRAGKGAHFHLPYAHLSVEEIVQWNLHFFIADLDGEPLESVDFKPPLALILSSEGHGPGLGSDKVAKKITIPMGGRIESLNVAAAGAILLYAMRKL